MDKYATSRCEYLRVQRPIRNNRFPDCAILSYRWGQNEISYQDLLKPSNTGAKSLKPPAGNDKNDGMYMIANTCAQAKRKCLERVWVDTCCIDKTSSAELGRSFNSMFKWYQEAQVCFAQLQGVILYPQNRPETVKQYVSSGWFRRGWTLQEMLAPREMLFFDCNWVLIGSRSQLTQLISQATKISPGHLANFRTTSSAAKMSWMSNRIEPRTRTLLTASSESSTSTWIFATGKARKLFCGCCRRRSLPVAPTNRSSPGHLTNLRAPVY